MKPPAPATSIRRWESGAWSDADDPVVTEEPLQLLLDGEPLSVVMRTPGHDVELALGLLFAEGIVGGRDDVRRVRVSSELGEVPGAEATLLESNHVDVELAAPARRRPRRATLANSACGICGVEMIEDLRRDLRPLPGGPVISAALLPELPARLRAEQAVFERTGGLHAAGLFSASGELIAVREDIGRHNALDKIVGRALLAGRLPLDGSVLVVSGRAGYEIVQKAIAAGIPVVAAVGAPSSLAVALAREFNLTLAGFLRGQRFNVYAAPERIA